MMSIEQNLLRARKAAHLTQQQLADAAGLTRMTVNKTESGAGDPRLSSVIEMARALGMELILVPSVLQPEVEAFLRSGGRVLGQPVGAGAPPSIVDSLGRPA
ncbi:helix-turn-helix transcriptional regulator [Xylophilus sp. GOD-11R]|uniref:helix-turn-helix transcriptional regulator n=1 Tax=Xylophilus sp. GOD-11R TaxID=3089814 RepID=UPI00298C4193|nr:helix-turn-helix transcriptional regulator [Xylophilus sp. GOD-11R]WPB57117.1 helix-turn-helix transcriptional regulator [Xylophilus sp. GOD-11R]